MKEPTDGESARYAVTLQVIGVSVTIAAVVFAVGTFLWISYYQSFMSDDFNAQVAARGTPLIPYLTRFYESSIGRMTPSVFAYVVLPHRKLFALLNTTALLGIIVSVFRLGLCRWPQVTLRDATLLVVLLGTFWFGSPVQDQTMMWRVGAFNYSWVLFMGLLFAIPYGTWFADPGKRQPQHRSALRAIGMLLFGVIVGLSHEQMAVSLCWLGLWLLVFAVRRHMVQAVPLHLWTGAIGLVFGLGMIMFAPGNNARIGAEPAWAVADRAGLFQRFMWQAFETDWAAGYMWLGLLLVLGLGVGMSLAGHGIKRGVLTPPLAFFTAAAVIVVPLYLTAWSTSSRATFFSFALVVVGALALMPLREKTVVSVLSNGSLVTLALFVALLLVADSGFEIRQTRILEKEIRWRTSMIVRGSGEDRVLPRIEANTRRFQNFHELESDPEHWRNHGMATYYGVSSLRVEEE